MPVCRLLSQAQTERGRLLIRSRLFLYGSMQVLEPLAIGVILIATNKKELTI